MGEMTDDQLASDERVDASYADVADCERELRDALTETTNALAYLWEAEGLVDGFAVRHAFADNDPLQHDIPAAIAKARFLIAAHTDDTEGAG